MTQPTGQVNSFVDWLQFGFQLRQEEEVLLAVMICWMLWKNRIDLIWKQRNLNYMEVVNSAFAVLKQ